MAACALRRRAVTAIATTARAAFPQVVASPKMSSVATSHRLFSAAATTHRLSSAAATAHRLSSAAATMKTPSPVASSFRRSHASEAIPEAFEARIQRLEVDLDNRLVALRLELQTGTAQAVEKVERGVSQACSNLEKAQLNKYAEFLQAQARHDERLTNLGQFVFAEGRRSVHRAGKSTLEHANAVIEVGKVSWRVVVTVVGAAASVGFATAQLLRTGTMTQQTEIADQRVATRTAELRQDFSAKIEETVSKAIGLALAKEATRTKAAAEDSLQSFTSKVEDVLQGLDTRIERAVELALAKQALQEDKKKKSAKGAY